VSKIVTGGTQGDTSIGTSRLFFLSTQRSKLESKIDPLTPALMCSWMAPEVVAVLDGIREAYDEKSDGTLCCSYVPTPKLLIACKCGAWAWSFMRCSPSRFHMRRLGCLTYVPISSKVLIATELWWSFAIVVLIYTIPPGNLPSLPDMQEDYRPFLPLFHNCTKFNPVERYSAEKALLHLLRL